LGPSLTALPTEARTLILTQLQEITDQPEAGLGVGLAVSLVAALLSASKGMVSLVTALNIAYDEDETRTFLRLRALALVVTLAMTVAAGVGVGGMVVVGNVAERLGPAGEAALSILRWPVLGALVVLGLAALYRYAPARDNPRWRWVTPGAIVATVLWLVGSVAFSVYAAVFGDFQKTYGTLNTVVVLLLWLFVTAYIIVLGAELDAETERQTARDSTVGPTRPLGRRRAYAADTVGPPAG
ncbi:MAG: YihY/virulence factor BrkB family protein, partial [Actinomycetota bacterium]|nr:YihY/virulence factor BrkB family protein [Actinomycetota bacterium]